MLDLSAGSRGLTFIDTVIRHRKEFLNIDATSANNRAMEQGSVIKAIPQIENRSKEGKSVPFKISSAFKWEEVYCWIRSIEGYFI